MDGDEVFYTVEAWGGSGGWIELVPHHETLAAAQAAMEHLTDEHHRRLRVVETTVRRRVAARSAYVGLTAKEVVEFAQSGWL